MIYFQAFAEQFNSTITVPFAHCCESQWAQGRALPDHRSAGSADAFVRKYDFDGPEKWASQFGTTGLDQAQGIAIHETGTYADGRICGGLPGQTM